MQEQPPEKRFAAEGRISWHELHTSDVGAAEEFYGRLFNWSFSPPAEGLRGFSRTIFRGDASVGYIVESEASQIASPRWLPYMNVPDVDEKLNDVTRLGGRIVSPPTEQHGMGVRSIIADNTGAMIGLLSVVEAGETVTTAIPGAGEFLWNDLLSRKPLEAGGFYGGLCGLQLYSMDLGDKGTYYLLRRGETNEAGIMLKPEAAEGESSWLAYAAVAAIDEACVAAGHFGGAIHIPPRDLHGAGRYAVIGDPTGASLALFQPSV